MITFEFLCEDEVGNVISVEVEEMTYWEAKKVFIEENPILSCAVIEVIDGETGANLEFDR